MKSVKIDDYHSVTENEEYGERIHQNELDEERPETNDEYDSGYESDEENSKKKKKTMNQLSLTLPN